MRGGSLALLVAGVVSCRSTGAEAPGNPRRSVATLARHEGGCDVLPAGMVDWQHAEGHPALYEDDRVRTFKGASAQLEFVDGSTLRLDEESLITLGGGVLVERGAVEGALQAGLRLKTPALEAESLPARDIVFR